MKKLSFKFRVLVCLCFLSFVVKNYAQQGNVSINQDKNIDALLNAKKDINKNEDSSDRYKIQIYNGNRAGAYAAQKDFHETFANWSSRIVYESPNFKIWAGNFRTRLEADKALKRIKSKFASAFIFKPKKG
ncbi:SPOR domain-containing protein [Seonamhaeicola algicola]|uniref:SPOR domain-containing protein n=2 Tax=Seonamhaeicola TaxID=1649495 RepID=A0A5C7AFV7_9FLAO|nr:MULTISPECIES: SPOR domain-containing protein [Seonamhaeicola]TXE06383.1 SPOR domain-containing protein [Seonamhaeicola algicola]TYA79906.1 SPOR domain-containing protein [Seonamhaeicola marinus]